MITHRKIFSTAWPYTLSMATSFIMQAVDSTMVAPFGTNALAALGVAAVACFIPISLIMGLITTVQKRVASTEDQIERNRALSGNMILGLVLVSPFVLLYFLLSQEITSLYTNQETAELAASYIQWFCPSFIFSALNLSLNGYLVGALKSKSRLMIILAMTGVNVTGNLLLSPVMGLPGVALASTLSIAFGFLLNMALVTRLEGYSWASPRKHDLIKDLHVIFGVSLHQISLALTLNAAVALVGQIGVEALAIANVVGMLSLPALYLGIGYGVATGSYIIQTLKKRENEEARKAGRMALIQVGGVSLGLGLLLYVFSDLTRRWFFRDSSTFELAQTPFLLLSVLFVIDGLGCTLQRFHFVSDGLRKSFLIMTFVQWGLFLPIAFMAIHFWKISYPVYFALHLGHRLLIGLLLFVAWRERLALPSSRYDENLSLANR